MENADPCESGNNYKMAELGEKVQYTCAVCNKPVKVERKNEYIVIVYPCCGGKIRVSQYVNNRLCTWLI